MAYGQKYHTVHHNPRANNIPGAYTGYSIFGTRNGFDIIYIEDKDPRNRPAYPLVQRASISFPSERHSFVLSIGVLVHRMSFNKMENITICGDDAFGPRVNHCRGGFDFTLFFEECFFSIVPSVLLLLALPIRYNQLRQSRLRKVSQTWLYWAKLVCLFVLFFTSAF